MRPMPMNSDPFSAYLATADDAINSAMANVYVLHLPTGRDLDITAIWDSSQQEAKGSAGANNPRQVRAVSDYGALTVLQNRLSRDLVVGAVVDTPLGQRRVIDLDYLDETTTVLQLGLSGSADLPAAPGVRFTKQTV